MENYLLLESIHLLGVTIFLGNIIVTAVWKMLADKTKSPAIIAYAQRLITITDFAFTASGALLILVSGRMMASKFGAISISVSIERHSGLKTTSKSLVIRASQGYLTSF